MNIFLNNIGQLRNIWWVAVFFGVLAFFTVPIILLSQTYKWEVAYTHQSVIVLAVSWLCQLLRKRPFTELTGAINFIWFKHFLTGTVIGAALMLSPAVFLYLGGWVSWQTSSLDDSLLLSGAVIFLAVAVAEEFLFRGFLFQRLIEGFCKWSAQLIMAGYFLLIHINKPEFTVSIKPLASINIFLASIMFGLAFIKTRSLAMPIGIHFMANLVQGPILGFGVSGNEDSSLLQPIFHTDLEWITGGNFGLEGSLPGLFLVIVCILLLHRWQPSEL
ncbi:MAG: hypothetical protein CVV25_12990 [Ignavibacteriae bacterium HGW-Ignavibacteriae-4]|jgi:hypothetical protein|nr:MAG: hypothetical protein CVV25_12990 [Ignavibacteriae bacterium HGW-Ignavibacteriae-4]